MEATIKNNRLIAKFLKWDVNSLTTIPKNLHLSNLELDNGEFLELKFDSDWNWLMAAVEKIEITNKINEGVDDFYNVTIGYGIECTIEHICKCNHTKIKSTYDAVVEFIEWYNNNYYNNKNNNNNHTQQK